MKLGFKPAVIGELALLLFFSSCGGSFGGGIGGSGLVFGPIEDDNPAALLVEGVAFDTSEAEVLIDGEAALATELRTGMVVTVLGVIDDNGSTGVAQTVEYDSVLEGPLQNVDLPSSSAQVLDTILLIDDDTVFDGFVFDPASIGSDVEVSGFVDSGGGVRVTRLAPLRGDATGFSLSGRVRNLDEAAKRFSLLSLTVDYALATIVSGAAGPLREGLVAAVRFAAPPSGGLIQANRIRLTRPVRGREEGTTTLVQGIVTEVLTAQEFMLNGRLLVRTNADTRLVGDLRPSDILPDIRLLVLGRVTADSAVLARRIERRLLSGEPAPLP
ncbi:MAG: DUF5666 domain-containing protein [Candidatus Binatia bacterium]